MAEILNKRRACKDVPDFNDAIGGAGEEEGGGGAPGREGDAGVFVFEIGGGEDGHEGWAVGEGVEKAVGEAVVPDEGGAVGARGGDVGLTWTREGVSVCGNERMRRG